MTIVRQIVAEKKMTFSLTNPQIKINLANENFP